MEEKFQTRMRFDFLTSLISHILYIYIIITFTKASLLSTPLRRAIPGMSLTTFNKLAVRVLSGLKARAEEKHCCSFIKHYLCLYFQGVLTQETDRNVTIFGRQYVAASYVKFIESAGGRMVPILYPFANVIFCNFILYLLYIINIIFCNYIIIIIIIIILNYNKIL